MNDLSSLLGVSQNTFDSTTLPSSSGSGSSGSSLFGDLGSLTGDAATLYNAVNGTTPAAAPAAASSSSSATTYTVLIVLGIIAVVFFMFSGKRR